MQRLVLYPHGLPPDPELCDHCAELVIHCGGDVQRVIDRPVHALGAFIKHLQRARLFERPEPAIVVLTQTNPVGLKVVGARRTLEAAIPALKDALWLVYCDPLADPFFRDSATSLGPLDEREGGVAIWLAPEHKRFLMVSPETDDPVLVAHAAAAIDSEADEFASGVVRRREEMTTLDSDATQAAAAETLRPPKIG